MNSPPFLDIILAHVATSTVLQLFLASSIVLAVGLAILIWLYAVKLHHVTFMPLNIVERTHPQLPRVDSVLLIVFCHACVLLAVLLSLLGAQPFSGPYQWVALLAALVLSAGISIYAELKHRDARPYAAGVALGTAVALFLVALRLLLSGLPMLSTIFPMLLLILAAAGSFRMLTLTKVARSIFTAVFVIAFWITLFSLPLF